MEEAIVFAAIVQAICGIIIAVANVRYTSFTRRILEVQIPPALSVELVGLLANARLEIENDASCKITNVEVWLSVGFKRDGKQTGVRRVIFTHKLKSILTGQCHSIPVKLQSMLESLDSQDMGLDVVNPNDLVVEYSFVRDADRRRFCYWYPIAFSGRVDTPQGDLFCMRHGDPRPLPTIKKMILERVKNAQE